MMVYPYARAAQSAFAKKDTSLDADIGNNTIDLRKTYEHGDQSRWNRWHDYEDGQVDEVPRHGLTYMCRRILAPQAMRVPVYLGSSAGMKVWLNGTCVHTFAGQRDLEPNQDIVQLSLKKGDNWLVMKFSHPAQGPRQIYTSFIKTPGSYNLEKITGQAWREIYNAYPVESDWMLQSAGKRDSSVWLSSDKISRKKLEGFVAACRKRRNVRLQPLRKKWKYILFTKHGDLGGSHYAYTEGQSDAQAERQFLPGSSLCVLELNDSFGRVHTLTNDAHGTIRDPDVSYDGKHVLFAWKKSDREDDYHLYEMDVKTRTINQVTEGLGFADYEGVYLLDDGRVIYTRWDYNDRGQIYPQPLFQMNYDGTGQTEYYGNNSWFPTTIMHARGIPDSRKLIAVLSGHHSRQQGKLALVDTSKGRQEAEGIQLVAPVRETEAVKVDSYGQQGDLFQYPYALSETNYLVAYRPDSSFRFGIYYMTADGERELLVYDPEISCNQPVPLGPRPRPHLRPGMVDYRKDTGTYYVHDIYHGPGLKDVPRGSIKKLRVVALEFRAAGIGSNGSGGPAGGALSSTPIAIGNGAWDVKKVLGETPVYEDGSACVVVPARTPVYFQAVDENGHVAQTMRSWSTLMPGETFACVGCHEHKNAAPPFNAKTRAMVNGPRELDPFQGPARGFSYLKEVQPVLDAKCVSCHNGSHAKNIDLRGEAVVDAGAKRKWSHSYLTLTQSPLQGNGLRGNSNGEHVKWISAQSVPSILPPYFRGSATSPLISMLKKGHQKVKLTQAELDRISCWIDLSVPYCGDYYEANTWNEAERRKYDYHLAKRREMEEREKKNIKDYIAASLRLVHYE